MKHTAIHLRESIIVYVLVTFFGLMCFHSLRVTLREKAPFDSSSCATQIIVISVEGAVEFPGRYHFKKGTKIGEVLKQIPLQEQADLSRLNLDRVILKSRKLKIPFKKIKGKKASRIVVKKKKESYNDKSCFIIS